MKTSHVLTFLLAAMLLSTLSCSMPAATPLTSISGSNEDSKPKKTYHDLIVGYAQLGAESEWRAANTLSIKETAEEPGVELRFIDAQ